MKRVYNVIITSNSGDFVRSYSITHSKWKVIRILLCILAVLIFVSALFYGRLYLMALRVRSLEVENKILREENAKVKELQKQLYALEELRVKIYNMLGIDKTPTMETVFTFTNPEKPNEQNIQITQEDYAKVSSEFQKYAKILYDEERYVPRGMPTDGFVSQKYGSTHRGLDLVAPIGTPVLAPADGIAKDIREDRYLGLVLTLSHGSKYETLYGHLKEVLVKRGQIVKKGDVIALTGNSGISTGPHLHYEIKYMGENVNPENYTH